MKIAFLSHLDLNLYLFRLPIMQKLVNQGHTVYAVCPRGEKFGLFKQYGIDVVEYNIDRGSLNPIKELKAISNMYKAIKLLELDILHTFTAKPNIYGTIAGKFSKVPVVINLVEGLGSFYIEDSVKNKMMRTMIEWLYKGVFSFSHQVVFVNNDDPQYLMEKKVIQKEKITIIKSVGIDTEVFDPKKVSLKDIGNLKKLLKVEGKLIVLMVARAIWHKGVREFYEASEMLSNYEDIQFILVGDVDRGNPSSADENFLRTANVLWLGHRDDIVALTALCDIYVLPSYREGVPRTLLEAASMAKPIIATDTVGCREVVIDEYNGYLIPIKNSQKLAEKINLLASDSKMRDVMGKNGRILALDEFTIDKVVEQYMSLYNKFLDERGSSVRKI